MGFTAVCMSGIYDDQRGFASYEDAVKHVEKHICGSCREDLKRGYIECQIGKEGEIHKYEIYNPLSTSCGAEWTIITDEEYDLSDDLTDILIASGMKPSDEKTEATLTPKQIAKLDQKQSKLRDEK